MKTSVMILVVLLLFVSIDYISSDKRKQMCDIFKPNGVFGGVKAYLKARSYLKPERPTAIVTLEFSEYMYANGMEWKFDATKDRIILLEETMTSIRQSFSVIFKVDLAFKREKRSRLITIYRCNLIRSQPNRRICDYKANFGGDRGILNETTDYNFDDMIALYIDRKHYGTHNNNSLRVGLIDRNHCSNDKFYSIRKDEFHLPEQGNKCWESVYDCKFPYFMADIPMYWRNRLDAILDFSKKWLILLNNNSRPLFCMADKDMPFMKACSEHKLKRYGDECADRPIQQITTISTTSKTTVVYENPETTDDQISYTSVEPTNITLEITTNRTDEQTSETTPLFKGGTDWLKTIGLTIGLTAILSMVVITLIWFLNKSDDNYADIDYFERIDPQMRKESYRRKLVEKYALIEESGEKGLQRLTKKKGMADTSTQLQ